VRSGQTLWLGSDSEVGTGSRDVCFPSDSNQTAELQEVRFVR
jgi:hypothetical protein